VAYRECACTAAQDPGGHEGETGAHTDTWDDPRVTTAPTDPATPAATPMGGRPARRRRPPAGLVAVGVVIAAVVAYALWAGVEALGQRPLVGTVTTYSVVSDTKVEYGFVVTGVPGSTVQCAILARARDFVVVGQDEQKLEIGTNGEARITGTVTTLRVATNAEAGACEPR
jgi:ferric-dicitrate binding protein FerR (iron transport regulator)